MGRGLLIETIRDQPLKANKTELSCHTAYRNLAKFQETMENHAPEGRRVKRDLT